MQERIKGFVVGSDIIGDKKVFKVRVKDDQHKLNGKKFVVASTHDNFMLVQGLDVDFLVGTVHGKPKAIDIALRETKKVKRRKGNAKT